MEMVEVAGRCSESQASGDDYGGWWGVQWGLEEGHFLNINCNCSVIIDQLSLICGGCKLW